MSNQNPFNEEGLIRAVLSFINAKTPGEGKAIVQAYKDNLLTPAAANEFY